MVLKMVDEELGLIEVLGEAICDRGDRDTSDFTLQESLMQQIYQIGGGWEDGNDAVRRAMIGYWKERSGGCPQEVVGGGTVEG